MEPIDKPMTLPPDWAYAPQHSRPTRQAALAAVDDFAESAIRLYTVDTLLERKNDLIAIIEALTDEDQP